MYGAGNIKKSLHLDLVAWVIFVFVPKVNELYKSPFGNLGEYYYFWNFFQESWPGKSKFIMKRDLEVSISTS